MQQDKITDLPELAVAAADDVLEITDVSTSTSNKIQAKNLAPAVVAGINPGGITPDKRSGGFKIGVIGASTVGSTGHKAITGLGFKPKLVRFSIIVSPSSSTHNMAFGAMTTEDQYYSTVGGNGTNHARYGGTDACIGWVSATGSSPTLKASYVSMDEDGFTINVTSASSTFAIAYEAYA